MTERKHPVTISKNAAGLPPTTPSRTGVERSKPANADRLWYLEATVVLLDGTFGIERVEKNSIKGRHVMDIWAMSRVQHNAVDYIKVEPVHEPTHDRAAGYLTKSERPIEVIGLPGKGPND